MQRKLHPAVPEIADTTSLGNSPQKYMIFALGPHISFSEKEKKIYVKCIYVPSFLYLTSIHLANTIYPIPL